MVTNEYEVLSAAQVATWLQVAENTVRNWMSSGELQSIGSGKTLRKHVWALLDARSKQQEERRQGSPSVPAEGPEDCTPELDSEERRQGSPSVPAEGPEDCTPELDSSADWDALRGGWKPMTGPGFAGYSVADDPEG
jgi:hypothetical protein